MVPIPEECGSGVIQEKEKIDKAQAALTVIVNKVGQKILPPLLDSLGVTESGDIEIAGIILDRSDDQPAPSTPATVKDGVGTCLHLVIRAGGQAHGNIKSGALYATAGTKDLYPLVGEADANFCINWGGAAGRKEYRGQPANESSIIASQTRQNSMVDVALADNIGNIPSYEGSAYLDLSQGGTMKMTLGNLPQKLTDLVGKNPAVNSKAMVYIIEKISQALEITYGID